MTAFADGCTAMLVEMRNTSPFVRHRYLLGNLPTIKFDLQMSAL